MNKRSKRKLLSLLFNLVIVVLEVIGTSISYSKIQLSMFRYYTVDSNILALIASLLIVIMTIFCLNSKDKLPKWVINLKYMATCSLAVTFIVVVIVLAPSLGQDGYKLMLINDEMLYHHLLCPLLSIVSFVLFDYKEPMTYKNSLIAIIPTVLYAIVLVTLNLLRVVVGPYPFLHVYEQPFYMSVIWFFGIDGGAYLLSFIIRQASKIKYK